MIHLAAALALLSGQATEPWSFNGMTSATTLEEFMPHAAREMGGPNKGRERCQRMPGLTFCEVGSQWLADFAGEPIRDSRASFGADGVMDGLWFALNKDSYERAVAALTTRYGQPCVDTVSEVQNAYGAKLPQREVKWCFSDGRMVAWQVDPGLMTRSAVAFVKARPERAPAQPNF